MFGDRTTDLERRLSAIGNHLRAIEGDLSDLGKKTGRRASAGATAAGNQIIDTIGPILSEITERFRRGQRQAIDDATTAGGEAMRMGARFGNDAMSRLADQTKDRPLLTVAVAVGVGVLIGLAGRRISS